MKILAKVFICVLASVFLSGCASWTHYRVITQDTENYQSFATGSPEWEKDSLKGKEYKAIPVYWDLYVASSGKNKDGKWLPKLLPLSQGLSEMDGMWNGHAGAYPVSTMNRGDISWSRYVDLPKVSGISLQRHLVVEVGNKAWTDSLTPAWPSNSVSRCFPHEFRIEIRSNTRNKAGWWVPDEGCDALGKEIMKFPGVL